MFKNVKNCSCPDHTITNTPATFQNTVTITAGISDFHTMVITALKTLIAKRKKVLKKAPKKSSIEAMKMLIGANSKKELETKSNENSNVIGKYDF